MIANQKRSKRVSSCAMFPAGTGISTKLDDPEAIALSINDAFNFLTVPISGVEINDCSSTAQQTLDTLGNSLLS